jgi:site-specific recombinase XerC
MAEKLTKRGTCWYYRFIDADGVRRMRKGCADKRVTEEMLRKAETEAAAARSNPKEAAYREHEARPIREHLDDYLKSLRSKGNSRGYVRDAGARARRVLDEAKIRHISELALSRVQDAIQAIREQEDLNQGSTNNYIRAVKGFTRWLWKDNRAREYHLAFLATANPEVDRRRVRRALTPEEAARVIQAAETGPKVHGMTGPDRAALYLTAIGSGFRAMKELKPLTPESFNLDGDPPTVTAKAAYTKNKRVAVQPIPGWLVERLRPWLARKAPGTSVFAGMDKRTALRLRVDLKAAGVPYETPEGVVDFHALRAAYITYLVNSGASVKTCQTLARHSTPSLTIGVYAKASLHDVKGAVEDLPDLTRTAPESHPQTLAKTGTDSTPVYTLAPSCIHSGVATGRPETLLDVAGGTEGPAPTERETLEIPGLDAPGRTETLRDVKSSGPVSQGTRRGVDGLCYTSGATSRGRTAFGVRERPGASGSVKTLDFQGVPLRRRRPVRSRCHVRERPGASGGDPGMDTEWSKRIDMR